MKNHQWVWKSSSPLLWRCEECDTVITDALMQALLWGPLEAAAMTPAEIAKAEQHVDYIKIVAEAMTIRRGFIYPTAVTRRVDKKLERAMAVDAVADQMERSG